MKWFSRIMPGLVVAPLVLFLGCAVQRQAERPSDGWSSDAGADIQKEDLLARLVREEQRVRSLQALQRVKLVDQRDGRSFHAQGFLAVRKPDRYRVRLYSALGATLLDFVLSPDGFRFRMPMEQIDLFGKKEEASDKIPYFPVEAFREAFVHSYEAERIDWRLQDGAHLLTLHRKKGEVRSIQRWVDRNGLNLLKERYWGEEGEMLALDYQDYRAWPQEEGLSLPYRIDIYLPREKMRLVIDVMRYEVNPVFREEMFDPYP